MPTFNLLFWAIVIAVPLVILAWVQFKSSRRVK